MVAAIDHNYNTSAFKGMDFILNQHTLHFIPLTHDLQLRNHAPAEQHTPYTCFFFKRKLYSVFWSVVHNLRHPMGHFFCDKMQFEFLILCFAYHRACENVLISNNIQYNSFVCLLYVHYRKNLKQQTLIKTNTYKRRAVNVTGSCRAPFKISSNIISCFLKSQRHTCGELGKLMNQDHIL